MWKSGDEVEVVDNTVHHVVDCDIQNHKRLHVREYDVGLKQVVTVLDGRDDRNCRGCRDCRDCGNWASVEPVQIEGVVNTSVVPVRGLAVYSRNHYDH